VELRIGMYRLLELERIDRTNDPQREMTAWMENISECYRLRRAFWNQQIVEIMTLDELGGRLLKLDCSWGLALYVVTAWFGGLA